MKKWNMMLLALSVLLIPAQSLAQDLPDFLSAVYSGIGEGLEQGAMQAIAAMDQELTLDMTPSSDRIEEGRAIRLTVTAGNPRPQAANVTITLALPDRLTASPDMQWEAALPGAAVDPKTGALVPSVTTFTREVTLKPGGGSETATLTAEMSMGTRFYRTQTDLALCVADVSAQAHTEESRLQPGDAFAYQVEIQNSGTAPKDVDVKLALPAGVCVKEALPAGFAQTDEGITGRVSAEAGGSLPLRFPVCVGEDVLEGDADAMRLLSGTLHVDGKRVSLPRLQVCGAKISASLLPESESVEAGEETKLSIVVVNSGLAAADVQLSCVLPKNLKLIAKEEATPGEAAVLPPKDGAPQAVPAATQDRTLVFDLHMDAARETKNGVIASTQVLEIPVVAGEPQDKLSEYLTGATLAWSVNDRQAQLGEAVAMRVYKNQFLGISKEEWSGVFWASMLLILTVACLYAAAHRDDKEEDFCCE